MNRRNWVLGAVAAAVVVVLGAGAVMAQTTGDTPGSTFLDRVAQKLGIDTPKLQKAITDTRDEDIDKAVQDGNLTQKQADALKQKIENNPGLGERGLGGPHGFKGGPKGFAFGFGPGLGLQDAAQQFADFLGITPDQLKTELQADNATIASVAEAHGKSRDQVKTFITDTAKLKLDQAVSNGDLTQKNEDTILQGLTDHIDNLLDHGFGFFKHGIGPGFGPGFRGHDDGNDDDSDDNGGAQPGGVQPQDGAGFQSIQNF